MSFPRAGAFPRAGTFPRIAAALLLGLGAFAFLPLPAAAQEDVPLTWSLTPDALGQRGDTFRLMFVSKNTRDGASQYISNYNSTVRTAAGNGHPDLYRFRNQFDALACTRDDDARNNTDTNPNSDGTGEPIYWVRGAKVADNYADFYDGSWDSSRDARVWEDGTLATGNDRIWTGCQDNGTEKIQYDLTYALRNSGGAHDPNTGQRVAALTRLDLFSGIDAGAGASRATSQQGHFYGLSPVFEVQSAPTLIDAKITSVPRDGTTFYNGEVIEVTLTFDEPVKFTGSVNEEADLNLHISQTGTKNQDLYYSRQDSPNTLVFSRTVNNVHRDTDGVCLGWNCRDDTIEGVNKFRSSIDNAISGEGRLSFDRHSTSYRVDGRSTGLTGGVCDRTWGVRNRLVTLVADADDCSEVTNQQLAGLSSLFVDGSGNTGPVASVAKRDFAGLDALTTLSLTNHDITGLADNVFDHIEDTLTRVRLEDNAIRRATGNALKDMANLDIVEMADSGLSHIEAGFFGTANLTQLELQGNDLTALPDALFENMTGLNTLRLENNPGFADFLPAVAFTNNSGTQTVDGGAAVEIEVEPGVNPWGGNLNYGWEQIDETGVVLTLMGANSKRLRFEAPVLGQDRTFKFRLTVTGKGTGSRSNPRRITEEAEVTVRREANVPTVTDIDIVSTPEVGTTYRAGETIELEVTYSEDVAVMRVLSLAEFVYPRIQMIVGSRTRNFTYDRTEDGNRVVFAYTVARNDEDTNGIALCPASDSRCSGMIVMFNTETSNPPVATITAVDDRTDASLAYVIPPVWTGHKVAQRSAPGISGIEITSRPGDDGDTFARGETIEATVTWDEDIEVRNADGAGNGIVLKAQFKSASGTGSTKDFSYLRRPSPRTMVFGYTVGAADADDNGLCIGASCAADTLELEGSAQIKAVFGNVNAALAHGKVETTWKVDGSEAGLTGGVCERTLAVRDALVSAAGVDDCSDVTITVLGRIADLDFSGDGLGELKAGDFDGLDELEELDLSNNALASLPSGLFGDLEKLETLKLGGNALTALPTGIFSGLASLEELRLGGNPVGSFPLGIFSGLAALRILDLEDMGLTGLRGTVFGELAALEDLDLKNNRLTTLPPSVFAGRGALVILDLEGNDLANLNPAGLFSGLDALEDLDLRDNELTTFVRGTFFGAEGLVTLSLQNNRIAALPDRIFELMTALEDLDFSGNPGAADFRPEFAVSGPARVTAQRTAALTATPGANPWGTNLLWDWVRTDAEAASLTLAGTQTAALSFEAPSLAADAAVAFTVTGTGRGTAASRSRDAQITIDATASATGVAITSLPVEGDTYRRDETIELTVSFTERVFVNGTPELGLRIGSGNGGAQQAAAYDRGTGTTELVFAYTVAQADLDNDGVTVDAGGLTLPNGATIRNVDLETAVLGNARIRFLDAKVDGRTPAAMGGICDRTRELREALVSLASGVASCADMDAAALAALPASLDLSNRGIAALKAGDFAGLGHVTGLDLEQNALTDITPGVLDPLTALTSLDLQDNAIARIPAGVLDAFAELTELKLNSNGGAAVFPGAFDRLTKLNILNLADNQLAALPDGIFEPLVNAVVITTYDNPGRPRPTMWVRNVVALGENAWPGCMVPSPSCRWSGTAGMPSPGHPPAAPLEAPHSLSAVDPHGRGLHLGPGVRHGDGSGRAG